MLADISNRVAIRKPSYSDCAVHLAQNQRSNAALSELLDHVITLAENFYAYSEGRLPQIVAKDPHVLQAMDDFLCKYKHAQPCGWDEQTMLKHCDQTLSHDQIGQIAARFGYDNGPIHISLQQLATTNPIPRGRAMILKDNLSTLRLYQRKISMLPPTPTKADGATEIDLPEALYALNSIHHVDVTAAIRDELAEMDAAKKRYDARVSEAKDVYDMAVDHGDLVETERAHRHLIAAYYESVVHQAKRVHHLEVSIDDLELNSFGKLLVQTQADAEASSAEYRVHHMAALHVLEKDLAQCDATREREKAAHAAAAAAYAQKERTSIDELNELVKQKAQVMEELRRNALLLRDISEQQKMATEDAMRAKREEAMRVTAYEEFALLGDQHHARLAQCLDHYRDTLPLVDEVERYVAKMVSCLPHDLARQTITHMMDDESEEFMRVYRNFVLLCGDLTVKKAHRLDTLERQVRLATHNRDSAMDSLDPNLDNYRLELEDGVGQLKSVDGVLHALQATQDAGEQVFETVETAVQEMCRRRNRVFVHPLQELGDSVVNERTRFVGKSMRYVENEEHEAAHKKSEIEEMKNLLVEDNRAVVRAIAAGAGQRAISPTRANK